MCHIDPATQDDWAWMLPRYVETAWASMSVDRRQATDRERVRQQLESQIEAFCGPEGAPNRAYVARDAGGQRLGFVWVIESVSGFTAQPFAWLMCLYVEAAVRRQGLGRRLMEHVEAWARERGLAQIVLNVSAGNLPARELYVSLGYQVETMRMTKGLQ